MRLHRLSVGGSADVSWEPLYLGWDNHDRSVARVRLRSPELCDEGFLVGGHTWYLGNVRPLAPADAVPNDDGVCGGIVTPSGAFQCVVVVDTAPNLTGSRNQVTTGRFLAGRILGGYFACHANGEVENNFLR